MNENLFIVLPGRPITKKNHTRRGYNGAQLQSEAYMQYESDCLWQISAKAKINGSGPYNMCCIYYMTLDYKNNKALVDLCGLLQSTCDILAKAKVITDDNCRVITGFDGSRVEYDKTNPRVEITLTKL